MFLVKYKCFVSTDGAELCEKVKMDGRSDGEAGVIGFVVVVLSNGKSFA